MKQLSLRVITPKAEIGTIPLPLKENGSPCSVYLRCLPGASAIHLAFTDGKGGVTSRAEVDATGGETVPIQVALGLDRDVRVWSQRRRVLTLPADALYDPPPPIPAATPGMNLDVALVMDGTARRFAFEDDGIASEPLLGQSEAWQDQVERLSRFAEILAEGTNGSRFAVLAFGDEELRGVETQDLRPRYLIHPPKTKRRFAPLSPKQLEEALLSIEPTPGGDFVDALADALQACRHLPWRERERARRIVLICGESPGHSLLHPLCRGADAQVRRLDVDVEAEHLHRAGIEIVTLYFDPPEDLGLRRVAFQRELLDGAREQYARLASLPAMAFEVSRFDPDAAARNLKVRESLLGRAAAPGELIGITEP